MRNSTRHPESPGTGRVKAALSESDGSDTINDISCLAPCPHGDISASATRRALFGGALALLAACGFTPVYAPGGAGEGLRGSLLVDDPVNRNEFSFVARLEQRLGQARAAPFRLAYTVETRQEGVGITPAQETTRYNVFGTADYQVIDRVTKAVLAEGQVENFTGYSATSLIVGTQSVTREAHERLMVILADQVVARLIATATDWHR